jgi:hypothetical protein
MQQGNKNNYVNGNINTCKNSLDLNAGENILTYVRWNRKEKPNKRKTIC